MGHLLLSSKPLSERQCNKHGLNLNPTGTNLSALQQPDMGMPMLMHTPFSPYCMRLVLVPPVDGGHPVCNRVAAE